MNMQTDPQSEKIPAWIDGQLQPEEKLSVHKRGLRHPAVSVFLVVDDHLLIQRRALEKYHTPGLWANTCCTHPYWGENAMNCAVRRLEDELGLAGLSPIHRGQIEYRADVGRGMTEHEVVDLFLVELNTRPTVTPNPKEVAETRWITMDGLVRDISQSPDAYTPWLRIYLEEHKTMLFSG